MRKSSLTAEQALGAEKTAEDRKKFRQGGLSLIKERDRQWHEVHPCYDSARKTVVHWGEEEGFVRLEISPYGKEKVDLILDAEELRKVLRWA